MAVSGRKLSDIHGSASLGSAEAFDISCEPCLFVGQHVGAHGFCVECQEYLCKNCFECHKKTKATRDHQLLDKDNVGKHATTSKDSDECTEKCSVHKKEMLYFFNAYNSRIFLNKCYFSPTSKFLNMKLSKTDTTSKDSDEFTEKCSVHKKEIIKFFCPTHKALGCNDCVILDHRTCNIDYIPDNCSEIGDSEEYMDIMKKLKEKMKEAEDVLKKAEVRDKEIDTCHAGIIKEILNFRKEINERLDQLQQDIQKDVDKKKANDKKIIQKVVDEYARFSTEIKKLQSSLQANKDSRQNGQLYINIKRAECKINSDEVNKTDEHLAKSDMQYSFERNTDLKNMLSKRDTFGKLNLSSSLVVPTKKKMYKKEDMNIKTLSENPMFSCVITGCAVLSSNKLVLADNTKKKVKVVDIQSKAVIEEKVLKSKPWDIAVMPRDHIAVTIPDERAIYLMSTSGQLSEVKKIPVKGKCMGITYHQDHLYVVCQKPNSVLVLDTQGNVQNTISLNNDIFKVPQYTVVSGDSRHIYISDYGSNCIVSITLQGDVSAVYKHKELSRPEGMVMLDDGSLLVCSYNNIIIHPISGDLKQCQIMIYCLSGPHSICYSHHHDEVYIGCYGDQLKVYSIK